MQNQPEKTCCYYEIHIEGYLDTCWEECFDSLSLQHLNNGDTLLTGEIPDQSALHGLLARIRDMNLKLICVRRL